MCGIFGTISRKAKPFNKRAFCTMGVRNDSRGGDSCGVFIDGNVEYGVDKQKLFIDFFRDSVLIGKTNECKVALGHCRKASVGKVSIETAQPVVLHNEQGEVDYVLIHNGTIYNYKELAEKYIPEVNIEGLTDSQVMARIFYHAGYDALDEYQGGAVFVMHDYRINRTLIFKGSSKKFQHSKDSEEERPLYYCWHNGRFCFSSIFETLYSFYYEEIVYTLSPNRLISIRDNKLKLVKEYKREKVGQFKPVTSNSIVFVNSGKPKTYHGYDSWDGDYDTCSYYPNPEWNNFKIKYDGSLYTDNKNVPMHGVFVLSAYGYVYPNRKTKDSWIYEVGFFMGRMLKHPDAFKMLDKMYNDGKRVVTKKLELLVDMLDFNPFTKNDIEYFWYDDGGLMFPQGEWKIPMGDTSFVFDESGILLDMGSKPYTGWTTDYNMYTYEENKILEIWEKLCAEV